MRLGILVTTIIFAWGLWGILEKKLVMEVHPVIAIIYLNITGLLFIPIYLLIAKYMKLHLQFNSSAVLWSLLIQICVAGAGLLFLFLLWKTSSYWAVAVTASYPVVTLILGMVFLKESASLYSILGVGLVIGGLILLNLK